MEWIRKETEGVRARIEEMQDILRTFGESEGEMLKTEADVQANVTILDDLEEHYGGLLMKMVFTRGSYNFCTLGVECKAN